MTATEGSTTLTPSAVDDAVRELRERILTGRLRGGDVVAEEDIAGQLNFSRTPVREAIGRLIVEGLLVKDGNRTSARVFQPSLQELLEIYEIRLPLEILAARMAAERAGDEFAQAIKHGFTEFQGTGFSPEWILMHERFHLGIFAGSQRQRLVSVIRGLRVQSEPYVRFAVQVDPKFRERSQAHHAAMVSALASHDGKQMERLVRRHLAATTTRVSELLESGLWVPSFRGVSPDGLGAP